MVDGMKGEISNTARNQHVHRHEHVLDKYVLDGLNAGTENTTRERGRRNVS